MINEMACGYTFSDGRFCAATAPHRHPGDEEVETDHAVRPATFDVVAVDIDTGRVRVLTFGLTKPNADAYVRMAVMRRGVETEFFSEATAGVYSDGDVWNGPTR